MRLILSLTTRLNLSLVILTLIALSCTQPNDPAVIRVVTELEIGESQEVTLSNGEKVDLMLLGIESVRDSLRGAVRTASIRISIDGEEATLGCATYHLPAKIGKVKIDCPVIKDMNSNSTLDHWSLTKDARFRLWPVDSPYMPEGTFVYPIKQEWLTTMSQSGGEPAYVDWGEDPARKEIYYHAGHDIGGAEGMDEIISAMNGQVIAIRGDTLQGYTDFPGDIRPDVIWVKSDLGWYIRYSHLNSTNPDIQVGQHIETGQKLGYIGKQGHSGGWVHLHFELMNKENISGTWATEDAFAYIWESYIRQYDPPLIALARPHQLLWTGQETTLDGSKSRSMAGEITSYEWTFSDGTSATGPTQRRSYTQAGEYSEILKVTDSEGNIDYDFTVVQVLDRDNPEQPIPVMQPAYHPTRNIKPGDPITFLVRTFNAQTGTEVWDFGDGSPPVETCSDPPDRQKSYEGKFAETVHSFSDPGDYIVRVERTNESGLTATACLHVVVQK